MCDITEKVLEALDLDGSIRYKKAIRGYKGFSIQEAIYSIINTPSIREASRLLGYYSEGPLKNFTTEILMPLFPNKSRTFGTQVGKSNWRFDLLKLVEHKHCCTCDRLLPFSKFGKHKDNDSTGLAGQCLNCRTFISKQQKVEIRQRTPIWANLEKIRLIYLNCPEGMHVDHIIPLKGTSVSGLHIENNLQYLLPKDNISKSNNYYIE